MKCARALSSLVLFNYTELDEETRHVVEQRTIEIKELVKRTAQGVIEIGLKLIEVKELLGHGNFGVWLKSEFDWSLQTAKRFMNAAEWYGQNQQIVDFEFAPSALYLLAAPSTPDPAKEEVLAYAGAAVGLHALFHQPSNLFLPPRRFNRQSADTRECVYLFGRKSREVRRRVFAVRVHR